MITAGQLRAARALIGIDQRALAHAGADYRAVSLVPNIKCFAAAAARTRCYEFTAAPCLDHKL